MADDLHLDESPSGARAGPYAWWCLDAFLSIGVGLCLARDGPKCVSSEVLRPIVPERVGAGRASLSTEPDERCHSEDTYLRGSHDITASRDVTHGCS